MSNQPTPTISVITATYNAAAVLPRLIESLAAQTDQDFEWVVADGGSTDGTLEILEKAKSQLKTVIIDSRPDFGIYDAMNRAVKISTGEYYLVAGADDCFEDEAVRLYKKFILKSRADLVTSVIQSNGQLKGVNKKKWTWLYGPWAYISGHAIGVAIKKDLHTHLGYYSRRLPIAADYLFLLKALKAGAVVTEAKFVSGAYESKTGVSGQDVLGALTESFRANILAGGSPALQIIIHFLRIIKNARIIAAQSK